MTQQSQFVNIQYTCIIYIYVHTYMCVKSFAYINAAMPPVQKF